MIRRATPADAEVLTRLGRETFAETFAADNTPEDMVAFLDGTFTLARQRAELADPGVTVLLAESAEGEAVGYVLLRTSEPPPAVTLRPALEIGRLYVRRSHHGTGAGGALMCAALGEARRQGAHAVWLGVWERNPRAIAFYRKCGFTAVGTQPFVLGRDRQTDFVMLRAIAREPSA